MEAGVAAMAESMMFTKKLFGNAAKMAARGAAGAIAKGAPALGSAGGAAARLGINATKFGFGAAKDFMRDRQLTKELYNSGLGVVARDFGIKMMRSTPEEINRIFQKANVIMQDKGNGVIAFYKYRRFLGIRDKDGSYRWC